MDHLADSLSQALNRSVNLQITVIPTMQGGKIIEPLEEVPSSANNQINQNVNQLKDQVFPKTKP